MVHKERATVLEDEPKNMDISKLTQFKANATHARASILEFTGILRSRLGGYVKPGEETTDLGIQDQENSSHANRATANYSETGLDEPAEVATQSALTHNSQFPEPSPGNRGQIVPLVSQTHQVQQPQEWPVYALNHFEQARSTETPMLDVFNLFFDPEMTGLLSNGELLESSHYNAGWFDLGFLDIED